MEDKNSITIFIDDEKQPVATFATPVNFELDTKKLVDGEHTLTIVSKDTLGREGLKKVPFTVRNGPAIAIEGLNDNVDGIINLMIDTYSKGSQQKFNIDGIESPRTAPTWLWVIIIVFLGWAVYYLITNFSL